MTSGAPWHVRGVGDEARETAQQAAHRAGLSVGEWLNAVIIGSAGEERGGAKQSPESKPAQGGENVEPPSRRPDKGGLGDVQNRLETLNQQIEHLSRAYATPREPSRAPEPDRTANRIERPRPPSAAPATPLDQALIEIAERQRALDGESAARPELPRAPTQGLSALETQLRQLNSRIDALHPCGIDSAVETLRDDLAEIGVMIKEAMPRQAIEALEKEVRALAARVDNHRHEEVDGTAIAGIERGLNDVHDALLQLKPAESLAGLDASMRSLTQKIEGFAGGRPDPAVLQQLESAIGSIRGIASQVASNEALANLSEEVRTLAAKVDQITGSDVLGTLHQRIATMADALEARHQRTGQDAERLEGVVERLNGKLEQLQLSRADHAAVVHLEDRIARLVEKLDSSDERLAHLEAIERGLAELLIHIEHQRVPSVARSATDGTEDVLKRDIQRTQDSLEAVHGALGDVVDRLAMIESGLHPQDAPEDKTDAPDPPEPFEQAGDPPSPRLNIDPPAPPIDLPSLSEAPVEDASTVSAASGNPTPATERERRPIDPDLPPNTPLEPGAIRGRSAGSPAERIAASEAALGGVKPPVIADPAGKTNFIAAARRAARAAANDVANRPDQQPSPSGGAIPNPTGRWNKRMRHLLVGSSVLLIAIGSAQLATNFLTAADTQSADAAPTAKHAPTRAASIPPSATPTQISANSRPLLTPATNSIPFLPTSAGIIMPPAPRQSAAAEPTAADGTDPTTTGSVNPVPVPRHSPARSNDSGPTIHGPALPESIGGGLRTAALKGNAAAEYDVAMRFEEGRGVPRDPAAAVKWLQRAAKRGLAPAQFRLGSHYEKGLGVKKDAEAAQRLYLTAAKAGNAKAMHNLAVLYAEGAVGGKPDYQHAARWFLKAAAHGVADSQYNLGILYARGIGVKADLTRAYKWFALASRDGDKEATKRRDETGSRLDPKNLKAARAAVQAWVAEAQPAAAVEVKRPAEGWDTAAASGTTRHHGASKPIAPPTRSRNKAAHKSTDG